MEFKFFYLFSRVTFVGLVFINKLNIDTWIRRPSRPTKTTHPGASPRQNYQQAHARQSDPHHPPKKSPSQTKQQSPPKWNQCGRSCALPWMPTSSSCKQMLRWDAYNTTVYYHCTAKHNKSCYVPTVCIDPTPINFIGCFRWRSVISRFRGMLTRCLGKLTGR